MAPIIDCPSCGRKLRLPDSEQDRKVRCPSCATIFDPAAAAKPSVAAPAPEQEERIEPTPDRPVSPPSPPPQREVLPANPEGRMICCPSCGADTPRRLARCQACGKELPVEDEYRPWEDGPERQQRLDCEPHRASTVLWVGIIGFFPVLGVPFSIAALVMGLRDLRKMNRKEMDVRGRSTTQAGWICGIVSAVLQGVVLLGCGSCFGLIVWSANNAATVNRNRPMPRPAATGSMGATGRAQPVPPPPQVPPPQPNPP